MSRKSLVCGLLLIFAVFLYYYLPPAVFMYKERADAASKAELWQTPRLLTIGPSDTVAGKQVSFRGVHFLSPWGDSEVFREFDSGGLLKFGELRSVFLLGIARVPPNFRTIGPNTDERGWLWTTVGNTAMKSNFVMEREILNTSPNQLTFSLDRKRMVRTAMFELAKTVYAGKGETGIYEFGTGRVRGFQKGDPEKSETVVLDVYDRNDLCTTIILATLKNAPTRLTQSEVNAFIASLDIDRDASSKKAASR